MCKIKGRFKSGFDGKSFSPSAKERRPTGCKGAANEGKKTDTRRLVW